VFAILGKSSRRLKAAALIFTLGAATLLRSHAGTATRGSSQRDRKKCLFRGLVAWVLIAVAETVHGTLRTLFLMPVVGDLASRQIGVLTGSVMILLISYAAIGGIGAKDAKPLVAVGLLWLILMVGFEILVGRAFGLSWERIISDYVPWQGGFMIVGMIVLALSPSIAVGLRSLRYRDA
jgi:hypothetical protein